MVRGTNTNGLVSLLVVLWATSAYSAPTFDVRRSVTEIQDSWLDSRVTAALRTVTEEITGRSSAHLTDVAAEFHRPTVRYSNGQAQVSPIKSLPSVPGTFVLVFLGFLSVTLVRDRRFWLAGTEALLWAGYAGFALLPQLASHLVPCGRSGRCWCNSLYVCAPSIVDRSNVASAGKLSALLTALPVDLASHDSVIKDRIGCVHYRGITHHICPSEHAAPKSKVLQSAIAALPECLDNCLTECAQVINQFLCSSRRIDDVSLARGPPIPLLCVNLLFVEG